MWPLLILTKESNFYMLIKVNVSNNINHKLFSIEIVETIKSK